MSVFISTKCVQTRKIDLTMTAVAGEIVVLKSNCHHVDGRKMLKYLHLSIQARGAFVVPSISIPAFQTEIEKRSIPPAGQLRYRPTARFEWNQQLHQSAPCYLSNGDLWRIRFQVLPTFNPLLLPFSLLFDMKFLLVSVICLAIIFTVDAGHRRGRGGGGGGYGGGGRGGGGYGGGGGGYGGGGRGGGGGGYGGGGGGYGGGGRGGGGGGYGGGGGGYGGGGGGYGGGGRGGGGGGYGGGGGGYGGGGGGGGYGYGK
ncbi:unnamed protein product [Allacma fusca]|uniref:Glycine-rich protein n=1 Tax=Allacma fusca TaxID=39272 RepID=A0A8J2K7N7_9HEXA|nr:unnamed protein product [Allacma fusca]